MNEELLAAWLKVSSVIDNHRLADVLNGWPELPFNEAQVCGLLASGEYRTASELCARTRILKSQMNAILHSLEEKGMIARERSQADRRLVEVRLLPAGQARYKRLHEQVLEIVDRVIGALGSEKAAELTALLEQTAAAFDSVRR